MSFPSALQSAIFYIVACTPCTKARHRRRTKLQAKKDRAEKADLEARQPGLYRHPSPFKTNQYWQDEIDMGPSLPRKPGSKNSSTRRLTSTAGRTESAASMSEPCTVVDSRTNIGDSTTVIPEENDLPEDWNKKVGYQREDEELWGQWPGHRLKDAFSKARDSAGRLIESTLGIEKEVTDQARREFYVPPTNPPVNDYHPPVVSAKVPHRDAHRWMLQPPPPAKVMEGKVPVSRATSSASRSSARTLNPEDLSMLRRVQQKQMMERAKREENRKESNIDALLATRTRSVSYSRSLDFSIDESRESLGSVTEKLPGGRPRPVARPPGESDSDSDEENSFPWYPRIDADGAPGPVRHAAQSPTLDTIRSVGSPPAGRRKSSRRTRKRRADKKKAMGSVTSPVGDYSD